MAAPRLPSRGLLYARDDLRGAYLEWASLNEYHWNGGVISMPLAGTATQSPKAVVGRLHAPISARIFYWSVSRRTLKPRIPHPDSGDANETLADVAVVPAQPVPDPLTGHLIFTVSGAYVYYLSEPIVPGKTGLRMGSPPYLDLSPAALQFETGDYSRHVQ